MSILISVWPAEVRVEVCVGIWVIIAPPTARVCCPALSGSNIVLLILSKVGCFISKFSPVSRSFSWHSPASLNWRSRL
jgi:hypothetical protein